MYKKMSSPVFMLLFSLAVAMFFAGCSGHSDNIAAPGSTKIATKLPFHNPPLRLLGVIIPGGSTGGLVGGGEEKSGGLCSWIIKMIVDGLQEGITSGVGDATTGKLFSGLNDNSGTDPQYAAINKQLTQISDQVSGLIKQNKDILAAISTTALQTQNTVNQGNITSDGESINTAWGTGSLQLGYTANSYMDISTKATDGTTSNTALNIAVTTFTNNRGGTTTALENSLIALNTRIITDGILTTYANMLVSEGKIQTAADANNAYISLQQQFGRILTYQIQALVMIVEMDNLTDKTGASAKSDLGSFMFMLQEEVSNFQSAVDYLMINLVDYRETPNSYANESGYMHKYGLAPDTIFNAVFATSRALIAQLVGTGSILTDAKGNKSFQPDYGLHGAIVLPKLYRYPASGTAPVSPGRITIKFKSYSSSQLGFANYSSTVPVNQPTPTAGRFPYTAWTPKTATASANCYPDNQWLLYEFSATQDFPAGKYHIILVDGGDNTAPWYHTETLYGNMDVLWYDPNQSNTSVGQGTITPTPTTVVKFGVFSGRWNWGYNMISMSPWIAPTSIYIPGNTAGSPVEENGIRIPVSNPYNNPRSEASKYLKDNAFYSAPLNLGMLVNPFPSWEEDEFYYTMNFPFTIAEASSTSNYTPLVAAPDVNIYYNVSENVTASQFKVDFGYVLNDTTANKTDSITNYMDQSFSKSFSLSQIVANLLIPANVTIKGTDTYNITAHAELNSNYPCVFGGCGERSGSIALNSDMQIIYTGMYSIPGL